MTKKRKIIFCLVSCTVLTVIFLLMLRVMNAQYERRIYSVLGELSQELDGEAMRAVVDYMVGETDPALAEQGKEAILSYGYTGEVFQVMRRFYNLERTGILFLLLLFTVMGGYYLLCQRNEKRMVRDVDRLCDNLEAVINEQEEEITDTESMLPVIQRLNAALERLEYVFTHRLGTARDDYRKSAAFLENISHQIKIPISDMRLRLELMEMKEEDPESELCRNARYCGQQLDRINDLVSRLMKIGQLESNRVTFHFSLNDIQWMMEEIIEECNGISGRKKINYDYAEAEYSVICDPVWIREALLNVVRNCVQYSRDDGDVNISLQRKGMYLNIIVQDEGMPIPVQDLPHIFERFYRAHNSKYSEGFGIGLNLAQLVVKAHHGTITARSMENGAEFEINLPFEK